MMGSRSSRSCQQPSSRSQRWPNRATTLKLPLPAQRARLQSGPSSVGALGILIAFLAELLFWDDIQNAGGSLE